MVNDDGDIIVTGELITNSHAKGCFIVFQGNSTQADIFYVLARDKESITGLVTVHSSINLLYGYDLEENALPNALPAVVLDIETTNTSNHYVILFIEFMCISLLYIATDSKPITSSTFLESASISLSGSSEVTVDCKVANGYPEASCVLVYREYGNTTLTVREYSQFSQLSITLSVDKPENYTFAIFGKNSEIEKHPAYIVKLSTVDQPLPSQPPSPGMLLCICF